MNHERARKQQDVEGPFGTELPPELADFLREQDLVALLHGSDQGPSYVVKAATPELELLGGTFPIGVEHQLFAHPSSPVIRTLLTFFDRPDTPLRLETFINIQDPDQRDPFAALADQDELTLLFFDEELRNRLAKRLPNATAMQIPTILAAADELLAAIPDDRRDFDAAKAAVMEGTTL